MTKDDETGHFFDIYDETIGRVTLPGKTGVSSFLVSVSSSFVIKNSEFGLINQ